MVYFIEFFILLLLPAKKLYFDASLLCFLTLPANNNIYTRFLNTNVNLKLKIYVNTIINIKKDIRDENRLFTSAICFRSFSLFCVKPLLCCHCCFTWILSLTLMIFNGMLSLSVFHIIRCGCVVFCSFGGVTLKEFVVVEYAKGYICSFVFSHRVRRPLYFVFFHPVLMSIVPFQQQRITFIVAFSICCDFMVFSSLILLQELPFAMCQSFKLRQIAVCTLIIHTYLPSVLYYKHFNMITCPFSHLNGSVCRRPSRWCFRRTYF